MIDFNDRLDAALEAALKELRPPGMQPHSPSQEQVVDAFRVFATGLKETTLTVIDPCPRCGKSTFDQNGFRSCERCGWTEAANTITRDPNGRVWIRHEGTYLCLESGVANNQVRNGPFEYLTQEEAFRPGAVVRCTFPVTDGPPRESSDMVQGAITWFNIDANNEFWAALSCCDGQYEFSSLTLVKPAPEESK